MKKRTFPKARALPHQARLSIAATREAPGLC
jgi:hypothetical protein